LARAHARSGNRVAIASYLGKSDAFDQAIAEFYAEQNQGVYGGAAGSYQTGHDQGHDRV